MMSLYLVYTNFDTMSICKLKFSQNFHMMINKKVLSCQKTSRQFHGVSWLFSYQFETPHRIFFWKSIDNV